MPSLNRTSSVLDLARLRARAHRDCIACTHPDLSLKFTMDSPHVLRTSIQFTAAMTSFNGMVHGGLLAFVIDEAMTCALMGKGIYGATADLKLRYKHPVRVGPIAHIRVWLGEHVHRLASVEAELRQDRVLCTHGQARFIEVPLDHAPADR